jgi:hypothetical protein
MLVWLGKQYLDQREPMSLDVSLPDNYLEALKQEALKLMQKNL